MVDVDRRLPPSHTFGLRRLSLRSSTTPSSSTSSSPALHSFAPITSSILSILRRSQIPLSPGLSESELTLIESTLNFSFPPDLRSLLSLALPASSPFPNWRTAAPSSLLRLPINSFLAPRTNLKRAPLLIPIFGRCYIPSRPSLAGNPVFFVDDARVFCCARSLQHFFAECLFRSAVPTPVFDKSVRWIEFWSDAANVFARQQRRRSSSCSSSLSLCNSDQDLDMGPDPEMFVEIRPKIRKRSSFCWVDKYMDGIGGVLREGGWGEEDVEEMVHVSETCRLDWNDDEEDEDEVVMDVLAMRAERWAEMLRGAGWSSDEVKEVMGEEFLRTRRREVKLPPEIRDKVEKLAEEILRF